MRPMSLPVRAQETKQTQLFLPCHIALDRMNKNIVEPRSKTTVLRAEPNLAHSTISIRQKTPAAIQGNGSSSARAWPKNSASSRDWAVAK